MVSSIMAEPALQKAALYITMSCRSPRHLHPAFSAVHPEALEIPTCPALVNLLHTYSRHRLDVRVQRLRSCCTQSRTARRKPCRLEAQTRCSASPARNILEPKDLEFA